MGKSGRRKGSLESPSSSENCGLSPVQQLPIVKTICEINDDLAINRTINILSNGSYMVVNEFRNKRIHDHILSVISSTFLPNDYPQSVKEEYLEYQLWDGIQGLCSYLRAVVVTRSLLIGAGVGESDSIALSAAISWVLKDGFGMIGSLFVAYTYADSFEVYTKEWRLIADILNNIGLLLDLMSSLSPSWYFVVTVLSSISKSCCGLIAGATKSRISSHFAKPGYLADVCAKESTQETVVALLGLLLGSVFAKVIGENDYKIWIFFFSLLTLHMYANYRLIRVLVFEHFNPQRAWLFAQRSYSQVTDGSDTKNNSPHLISMRETLFMPIRLHFYGPKLGISLQNAIAKLVSEETEYALTMVRVAMSAFTDNLFIVLLDSNTGQTFVALNSQICAKEIMRSYFCACLMQQAWVKQRDSMFANEKKLRSVVEKSLLGSNQLLQQAEERSWNINDIGSMGVGKWRYN